MYTHTHTAKYPLTQCWRHHGRPESENSLQECHRPGVETEKEMLRKLRPGGWPHRPYSHHTRSPHLLFPIGSGPSAYLQLSTTRPREGASNRTHQDERTQTHLAKEFSNE